MVCWQINDDDDDEKDTAKKRCAHRCILVLNLTFVLIFEQFAAC